MSKLDERAADLPVAQKVSSQPVISSAEDSKLDQKYSQSSQKPEKSIANGPAQSESVTSKRKQSRIRVDSDEDESDDEPLTKKSKTATTIKEEPETLLKLNQNSKTVLPSTTGSTNGSPPDSHDALKKSNGSHGSQSQSSKPVKKTQMSSADESDSDVPLQKSVISKSKPKSEHKTTAKKLSSKPKIDSPSDHDESSSEDLPLNKNTKKSSVKKGRDDAPTATKKQRSTGKTTEETLGDKKPPQRRTNGSSEKVKEESSDDEKPLKKRSKVEEAKIKKVASKDVAKVAKKVDGKKTKATIKSEGDEEDDAEEQYRWWEHEKEDNSVKWQTMEHNGVVFPDPYKRLPRDVKMKYDNRPLDLTSEAEEVAGFFGALIETDHAQNPVFVKNFFEDFQKVCKDSGMPAEQVPKDFKKCDFRPMFEYFEARKEEKKALSKEEKKRLKEEKDALEEKYKEAIVDGRKEKIGNFRIEPPGLFRGRGAHPKTGRLKTRVQPEQVTINIGENVPVPAPPEGHKWAEIKHDNTVTWLATWNENINNNVKYVMMAAGSSFKGQSDLKKYEKARTLKGCIRDIRRKYEAELSDKVMETRQRATAMYFIDKFALRAGNEKGEDEADTVGCCSLRLEHVSLKEPQTVIFDFLGKDSIRYYNEVSVEKQVFKNLMIFKKGKSLEDMIFDRLNTGKLNKHLTELMPGLSAKVFRTFNASFTFQEQLKQTDGNATVADKILAYNRANREVAILCNHQRTVSKTHDAAMEKIEDKVKEQKYQKMRLQRAMVDIEPKLAKRKPSLLEYESDIDDEWIAEHHETLYNREVEKIKKKFDKENEKLAANDEKSLPSTELKDRLKAAEDLRDMLKQEKKTKKVVAKSGQTIEKLEAQVKKLEERIAVIKTQMIDKDENKTTALGTSKINYIDPRLTFAWCAKYNVPIEKMFTKTLREKFLWAAETPADWVF